MTNLNAKLEVDSRLRKDGGPLIDVICQDTRNGRIYSLQVIPREERQARLEAKHNHAEVLAVLDSDVVSGWMIERPHANSDEFYSRFECPAPDGWFQS